MSPYTRFRERALLLWLGFWFRSPAPEVPLALLRIGSALVLIYVLFVRAFDLTGAFTAVGGLPEAVLEALNPLAWSVSVFSWVAGAWWVWIMYVVSVLAALALLLGALSPLAALVSLFFQVSYVQHSPGAVLSVDGLLMLILSYLCFVPSGRALGVLAQWDPPPPRVKPVLRSDEAPSTGPEWEGFPWSALPVRVLQLHLCALYLHSGLGKLEGSWLSGAALWHPSLVALGTPFDPQGLLQTPWLAAATVHGLLLFELLYGVTIWHRRLRYPVLALATLLHLWVGFAWGNLPFNFLMIALNTVFLSASHMAPLPALVRPLLVLPWVPSHNRD